MRYFFSLLLVLLFIPLTVLSQTSVINNPQDLVDSGRASLYVLKDKDGLPQNNILCLTFDKSLPYNDNNIVFEYALLSYNNISKTRYRTQLLGLDQAPSDWNCENRRTFPKLSVGQHTFKVWVMDCDGNISSPVIVTFTISPMPWRSGYAYLFYAIAALSSGYFINRYRSRSLNNHKQLLEAKVVVRTTELAKQKDELTRQKDELARKNEALLDSYKRADRIFSALADILPGTVLENKYRIEEKIGSGGFGVVYKATHLTMKRPIAIKVFKPIAGNDSSEAIDRFLREGVSACRVNHPNAVAVFDAGISQEGIAYIAMELLLGRSLAAELKERGPLSTRRCLEIFLPICEVLAEAHSARIVHRDIKPDNIFLHQTAEGEVIKVVDFGIAKLMDTTVELGEEYITAAGAIVGTPEYMSPERLQFLDYNGQSDVYSVGILLYQALCGAVPFSIEHDGLWTVIFSHINSAPLPPRVIESSIPAEIEALIMRALSKEPHERPTARELSQELASQLSLFSRETADGKARPTEPQNGELLKKLIKKPEQLDGRAQANHQQHRESPVTQQVIRNIKFCRNCLKEYEVKQTTCLCDMNMFQEQRILDGKYRLTEKLGAGGMGEVFKATHRTLNKNWAIKILHTDIDHGFRASERFLQEARLLSQIDHPNIVKVVDFNNVAGITYLVMELLQGNSLKDEIKLRNSRNISNGNNGSGFSFAEISLILSKVSSALDMIHRDNIIHRDLKTENIFLVKDADGKNVEVKIIDFGISLLQGTNLTRTHQVVGTPEYMSPEQCCGDPADTRSDIYSLGICLYELLTGCVPFPISIFAPYEILEKQVFENPKPLREIRPEIPVNVEKVVLRALEKNPALRQQSVLALVEEFNQAFNS